MSDESALRIGELASKVGVSAKAIRYYEDIGLLPAPQRSEAGYRLYGVADAERLQFIRKAAAVGLSLKEIGQLLTLRGAGQRPCRHLGELVGHKLQAVEEQIRALNAFRDELAALHAEALAEGCDDGKVCGVIEHHRPLPEDLLFLPKPRRPAPRGS